MYKKTTYSQKIKIKARRTLSYKLSQEKRNYVVDTSAIINKFLPKLIRRGLKGRIIIPNAVMAELENLANKGQAEGFNGMEEITKLHKIQSIKLYFQGIRPQNSHIKYAKSGEIDALIRDIARKNHAILVTSDLVQAKSAQAYGLQVIFLKPKFKKPRRKFLFFKLRH